MNVGIFPGQKLTVNLQEQGSHELSGRIEITRFNPDPGGDRIEIRIERDDEAAVGTVYVVTP